MIRGTIISLVTGCVLGLVLCLPIERASLIGGMVVSVVTSTVPAWLDHGRGTTKKRSTDRRNR